MTDRNEKQQAILARLEAGVKEIVDSASFQRYLDAQAKFHTYSWANTLLILMQRPDATRVAGYKTWQQLGRQVKKGEKGIMIYVPYFRKKEEREEEQQDEESPVWYGIGYVFDIRQTDGEPLPEAEKPLALTGDDGAKLYRVLFDLAPKLGISAVHERAAFDDAHTHGVYYPRTREIQVKRDAWNQMAKTLAHEIAHHLTVSPELDYATGETLAEGVAYVVCQHFGVESDRYSFAYVAHWAKDAKVLKQHLATIQKTAARIIDGVESLLSEREAA